MEDIEYIDNFFKEELSPEDKQRFDEKVKADPVFAEEVAFYYCSNQAIKAKLADEKKERFRELYQMGQENQNRKTPVILFKRWTKVAAAAIIVVSVGTVWYLWPQPSAKNIADKYIAENFTQLNVKMSNNDSLQSAVNLYNSGKWKESLLILEKLAVNDSLGSTVIKNAGIVSLQLKEYDKALSYFKKLEDNSSLAVNPGKFFHALVLVERNHPGDRQEATRLLNIVIENKLDESGTAAEMIRYK